MYPCNLPQHVPHITTPSQHFITMQAEEYWPMAREYGIWNAAIASLQFWTDDLAPTTLGEASECVYNYFFWTPISHTLHQLPEEILFGCFVLALNAAFMQHLSSQDDGYDSGSNEDVLTPLCTAPHIHHVSSLDNASFNLYTVPHTEWQPALPHTHLQDQSDPICLSMMTAWIPLPVPTIALHNAQT